MHIAPMTGPVLSHARKQVLGTAEQCLDDVTHTNDTDLLDLLDAPAVLLDAGSGVVAANHLWRARMRHTRGQKASYFMELPRVFPGIRMEAGLQQLSAWHGEVLSGLRPEHVVEGRHGESDRPGWVRITARRVIRHGRAWLLVRHEDVTRLKHLEEELCALSGRALRIQDEERRRIARELHDSTAQLMLAAEMRLDRLQRTGRPQRAEKERLTSECRDLVAEAQRELRCMSYLLHPPLIEEAGLAAAVRWYVAGFAKRSKTLTIRLSVLGEPQIRALSNEAATALFRILQEALSNAHRHSGGTLLQVRLHGVPAGGLAEGGCGDVVLTVRDDGHGGFLDRQDGDGRAPLLGVGIMGMRERVAQFSGTFEVRPEACGTTLRASLPITGR